MDNVNDEPDLQSKDKTGLFGKCIKGIKGMFKSQKDEEPMDLSHVEYNPDVYGKDDSKYMMKNIKAKDKSNQKNDSKEFKLPEYSYYDKESKVDKVFKEIVEKENEDRKKEKEKEESMKNNKESKPSNKKEFIELSFEAQKFIDTTVARRFEWDF